MIVNQPLYTPVGVLADSLIKPNAPADRPEAQDLFNAEMQAIADAFSQMWSMPVVTADVYLTANARNALIDLSGLVNTDTGVAAYLPPNPNVSDPPCIVIVQKSGYRTTGTYEADAVITTNDGTFVNGLEQSIVNADQVTLFNPGDIAVCVYVGGEVGWQVNVRTSVRANPNSTHPFQFGALGAMISPGQEYYLYNDTDTFDDTHNFNSAGQWFVITQHNGSITIGDATMTFNGVIGPYVHTAGASAYVRRKFILKDSGLTWTVLG